MTTMAFEHLPGHLKQNHDETRSDPVARNMFHEHEQLCKLVFCKENMMPLGQYANDASKKKIAPCRMLHQDRTIKVIEALIIESSTKDPFEHNCTILSTGLGK